MAGPLEGFRVIDVCRAGPGQQATGLLADYGADVVTIVEPGYFSRRYSMGAEAPGELNRRNKRSLFLNLRAPGAVDVFLRLAQRSDAILESNRPGVVKRLGIDYEAVRAVNPAIVYCSLSGFGQYGPYSSIAAHDLSYQGVAGMVPLTEDDVPRFPAYNQADLNAVWFGAMSILMGLLARSKGAPGQYIDTAFTDVAVTMPIGRMADEGLRGHYPLYQIFETKDGRYLTLSTREPWFWDRLCLLMEREDWIPHINPKGALNQEMFAFVREFFKGKTLQEWMVVLTENDLQFGPLNHTIEELRADPHIRARDMVIAVEDPRDGTIQYQPGFAVKFSDTGAELKWGPTMMGSDTPVILEELGYTDSELAALREAGVTA